MRRILRAGAAVFALLVAANVASAQGGGGGGGNGGMGRGGPQGQRSADALLKGITITDAQKGKIDAVVKWYDDESAKLTRPAQGADSATMAAFQASRMKLTADFRSKIRAELSADEQKTFDANVAAMPAGGRGGRRGGGGN